MGSTDRKTAPERSGVEQNVTCPAAKYVAGLRSTAAGPVIESLGRSARGFQHPWLRRRYRRKYHSHRASSCAGGNSCNN